MRLSDQQKGVIYENMLREYQRLQEQVRLIKSENVNLSEADQKRIDILETQMRDIYNQTQRLY
jgi:hypothetical protein